MRARAELELRGFQPTDREACAALFAGHVPGAFRAEERPIFLAWLDRPPGPVFVLADGEGQLVAVGGIASEPEPGVASLCWGVVHASRQREGLGRILLLARAVAMVSMLGARVARLSTIAETTGFFRTLGFRTERVDPDGHADGVDAVEMRLELTAAWVAEARALLAEAGVAPPA